MDKEIKEQFRSIQAMICTWGVLLLAMVSFLGFNIDESQKTFWGIVGLVASLLVMIFVTKDVWDTFKYKRENKKEELKDG